MRIVILLVLFAAFAVGQTSQEIREAAKDGRGLDDSAVAVIEKKLEKRPKDLLDRIRVLSFYTFSDTVDPAKAIAARRKHILWLAEEAPESEAWGPGLAIYSAAGRLSDPEGYSAVRTAWLAHLKSKPSKDVRQNAAEFLQLENRDTAAQLFRESGSSRTLGWHYGLALLGVTSRSFSNGDPLAVDPQARETPFAKQILAELDSSSDSALIGGTALSLARTGAKLWSAGLTDWDYSPLAKALAAKAQRLAPTDLSSFFINTDLPKPGEDRGLDFVLIGGVVQRKRLVHQVIPEVPAHLASIKGKVSLAVAVGEQGKVIKVVPTEGPSELYDISVKAVEQWVYRPTLLNGKPLIVLTAIDVNYR